MVEVWRKGEEESTVVRETHEEEEEKSGREREKVRERERERRVKRKCLPKRRKLCWKRKKREGNKIRKRE